MLLNQPLVVVILGLAGIHAALAAPHAPLEDRSPSALLRIGANINNGQIGSTFSNVGNGNGGSVSVNAGINI